MNDIKAVIGTNSWDGKAYGKLLRGSYVEDNVIREAMNEAERLIIFIPTFFKYFSPSFYNFFCFFLKGNTAQSPPNGFALNLQASSAQSLCGVALT